MMTASTKLALCALVCAATLSRAEGHRTLLKEKATGAKAEGAEPAADGPIAATKLKGAAAKLKGAGAEPVEAAGGDAAGAEGADMDLSGEYMYQTWMSLDDSAEPAEEGKMTLTKSDELEGVYVAEWMQSEGATAEAKEAFGTKHPGHGLLMMSMVGKTATLAGGWGIEGDDKSDDGTGVGGGVEYEVTMNKDGSILKADGQYVGISKEMGVFQGVTKITMADGAEADGGGDDSTTGEKGAGADDAAAADDTATKGVGGDDATTADAKGAGK